MLDHIVIHWPYDGSYATYQLGRCQGHTAVAPGTGDGRGVGNFHQKGMQAFWGLASLVQGADGDLGGLNIERNEVEIAKLDGF